MCSTCIVHARLEKLHQQLLLFPFVCQAMLEDKMRLSDMETTYDAIEEAVAKESYLLWLKEQTAQMGEGSKKGEVGGC